LLGWFVGFKFHVLKSKMSDWSDDEPLVPVPAVKTARPEGRGRGRPTNIIKSDQNCNSEPPPPGKTEEMLVDKSFAGRIIGRSGTRIKEIRETSGAQISVEDEGTFTKITISGGVAQIDKARDIVLKIIDTGMGRVAEDQKEDSKNSEEKGESMNWAELRESMINMENTRWKNLVDIHKNFYQEQDAVKNRSAEEVAEFRKNNNCIQVKNFNEADPTPIMNPVTTFEEAFTEYPDILQTVRNQGFERPSPIQAQMWPYLLSGKDTIGIAQTGTGKTLGFLLPAFIHIEAQTEPRGQRGGSNVLIFAPTRELAQQIASEVKKYEYRGIRSVCVYGGGSIREQLNAIEDGVEIIIATPGRFNHFVEKGAINLSSITYLVLDEADRMLDQGFEYEIRKTLVDIRPDRVTVMTSATWPSDVRRLADKYMKDPATVFVGSLDLAAVHSVTQEIIKVRQEDKDEELLKFIEDMQPDDKVIVFAGRKTKVTELSVAMAFKHIPCQSIHGDRAQEDREQALEDLRSGEVPILLATDVASRGIDIQDVTHVFNYDMPKDMEEYVHRIGRTGRAGKTGKSITLFAREDWRKAPELVKLMAEAGSEVPDWLKAEAGRFLVWQEKHAAEKAAFGGGSDRRGGGGRRFGGGGGGGGDGCFKCGESGHFSRECPQGGGGRRREGGGGGGRDGGRREGGGGGRFR